MPSPLSSNTQSTPLSPLVPGQHPSVSAQTSSSPTHVVASPRFSSHLEFHSNVSFKSRGGQLSGLKTSSSALGDPPSYQREITDGQEESSESYQLVSRRGNTLQHDMDLEVQRMKEKDVRLKRNIRRFRFVVRCAHLACRFALWLRWILIW